MSSKQLVLAEDPPSFLFHFPSPYSTFNYEDDTSFFLQHLHDHHNYTTSITEAAVTNMADDHEINHDQLCEDIGVLVNVDNDHGKTEQISVSSTKSSTTTKKVRQRKIETARGPRGRRMRLSLEVASEFFHLQDMLGFDKASMTIEWLLNKSKAAIKELASSYSTTTTTGAANTSASSSTTTSKCCNEVVVSSSIKMVTKGLKPSSSRSTSTVAKKKNEVRARRKIASRNPMAIRESRAKARARARELTREKTRIRLHQSKVLPCSGAMNSDLTQVRSWSPFVTGHQQQNHNLLGDWNSPIIFNYERDIGMPQEQYQSTGFQFNVNPTTT